MAWGDINMWGYPPTNNQNQKHGYSHIYTDIYKTMDIDKHIDYNMFTYDRKIMLDNLLNILQYNYLDNLSNKLLYNTLSNMSIDMFTTCFAICFANCLTNRQTSVLQIAQQ